MRARFAGWAAATLWMLCAGGGASAQSADDAQRAYEAALAVTPVPRLLQYEQEEWAQQGGFLDQTRLIRRLEELIAAADRDRAVRSGRPPASELARRCVDIGLDACVSEAGGYLTRPDGPTLFWQIQNGVSEMDGASGGFVLLALEPDGTTLTPLAWHTAPARYDPPRWVGETHDSLVVAVPGVHHGTGALNADLMFRWSGSGEPNLVQIDNMSWRDDLDSRLPEGLEVWKGVRFLYDALIAHTPLWLGDDANCCPSGGEAILDFDLQHDRLVLKDIQVTDAVAVLAEAVPADVFAWVQRRMGCAHWTGEDPYDPDRRAQIDAALERLGCPTLDAEETELRRIHAENPDVIQLLNRNPPS